jgi:transaldolase
MRIFLATANLDDIRWAAENGLADGVATTPTMLAAAGDGTGRDLLGEICRTIEGPVCAAVPAVNAADIYREGRELAKIADSLIVQIPLVEDAVVAIRRLSAEGIRVAATLVFNAAQAVLAAKAGASMVATSIEQLDAYGLDSLEVLHELRAVFAGGNTECDVMAMFPHNATQFAGCAIAGVDTVTVTPSVLRMLLLHPLTDRGIDQFLSDLAKRPKARVTT